MTRPFQEYSHNEQIVFAKVIASALKTKKVDTVARCMALAHINVTMGAPDMEKDQFRIEKDEAAQVLVITLREYL